MWLMQILEWFDTFVIGVLFLKYLYSLANIFLTKYRVAYC